MGMGFSRLVPLRGVVGLAAMSKKPSSKAHQRERKMGMP